MSENETPETVEETVTETKTETIEEVKAEAADEIKAESTEEVKAEAAEEAKPEVAAEAEETTAVEVVPEIPAEPEEISYHAVEKEGEITAIWEMQGKAHLRTISARSGEGQKILSLFTSEIHETDSPSMATAATPEAAV